MSQRSTNYRIAGAKQNKNRTKAPMFPKDKYPEPGTEYKFPGKGETTINKNANEKSVLNHLGTHAGKNTQLGQQSKDLLNHLGGVKGGWKVSAGVHQGGLGSEEREPNPKNHITLSTGHHLRFNSKDNLQEITGKDVRDGKGRQGKSQPSKTEEDLAGLKKDHGLTDKQAGKALHYMTKQDDTGRTLPKHQAVAKALKHTK